MNNTEEISDGDRYPTLGEAGVKMLNFLREHPSAPIFRNQSGNRLQPEEVQSLRAFTTEVLAAEVGWKSGMEPRWLPEFLASSRRQVPHYRDYAALGDDLASLPTISRADLNRDIAAFFPDDLPLERLINFRTTGTTGHPLLLASHPLVAGRYLAFHQRALQRYGITLRHGRGQVGVVLAGFQEKCFTYVSVTPQREESGLVKLNLHPRDWRDPGDRARYLDALEAEVFTGDPLAFAELLRLPLRKNPRAMVSTSMMLSPALRAQLEARFQCPVLDLYSMNEAGPIAVWDEAAGGHVLLQNRLYLEILDPHGQRVPEGERGEITLTGGFNFCLPLIRYRTGDFASLAFDGREPVLLGLEGRPPVRFRTTAGEWKNNIEITHLLRPYPFAQFTLHQRADGSFHFGCTGLPMAESALYKTLDGLLGPDVKIDIEVSRAGEGKVVQYTSDLEATSPLAGSSVRHTQG